MKPEESQAISSTLQNMEAVYWYDVDTNWGAKAHEFYTEDGIFEMGLDSKPHVGRTAIQKFYAWRKDRGARTARHLITNLQVNIRNSREAILFCIMSLFAADGEPILPSKPAIMIADVVADYVRGGDGVWRLRRHTLNPVFMGGEAPTIMTDK
jgi:hypothetical protein